MKNKWEKWKKSYEASMSFCKYVSNNIDNISSKKVEKLWHNVFSTVLKSFNFPRKTRTYMWEELVNGNWNRLHLTKEEMFFSPDYWLQELAADVWYCSDRWSFDRLTRCHWLFRNYMNLMA